MKLSLRGVISLAQLLVMSLAVSTAAFAQSRDMNVQTADQTWDGVQPGARAGTWLDQGALRARTSQTDHRRDLIVGAPGGPGVIGTVHVIYGGPVRTGAQILSSADATISGEAAGDLFGTSTAAGNILSLEGVEPKNLAVGAPGASGGRGAVYLFAGSFGTNDVIAAGSAVLKVIGAPGDQLGAMLATADLDNDGYREIVIGAPGNSRVYVIRGGPSLSGTRDLTVTPAAITVSLPGIGGVLTAGDVTGDNIQDMIIGAPAQNTVYLFAGAGGAFPAAATAVFTGIDAGDMAGASLRIADMDADGNRDLLIGAPGGDGPANGRTDAGEVYLLWGGAGLATSRSLSEADVTFEGLAGERLGAAVAGGDVNRDQPNDAVMLAEAAASNTGILYIYYGRARAAFGSVRVDGRREVDFTIAGQVDRRIGSSPAIGAIRSAQVFEVTGEGARDIIVGIPTRAAAAGTLYFTLSPKMVLSQAALTVYTTTTASRQAGVQVINETPLPITWSAAGDQSWMSVTNSGSAVEGAAGTLTVTMNPAGLAVGTYTGTVTVTSTSPDLTIAIPIAVSFTVTETLVGLDSPINNSTVSQPFNIGGWALDLSSTSGPGVDTIHIWAFPQTGSPVFLAEAHTGGTRTDVGGIYGSQFNTSGFNLQVTGMTPGVYTVVIYVHNARTGNFDASVGVVVTVTSSAAMSIDTQTDGASLNSSFYMAGWAIDAAAAAGTGVDAIHIWAFPRDGSPATFLGAAAYGDARGDVGAAYGANFTNSGWHLSATNLAPGNYTIVAYAHSTVSGSFTDSRGFTATVQATGRMSLDTPPQEATMGRPFLIAGWALDLAAASGTGVDTIHVWATPANGQPNIFLGVASYGAARPDVGTAFGNHQFDNCGYNLGVDGGTLAPGTYTITVYVHSSVANAFTMGQARVVTVQ